MIRPGAVEEVARPLVAYAPADCTDRRLTEVLELTQATLVRFCGGAATIRLF